MLTREPNIILDVRGSRVSRWAAFGWVAAVALAVGLSFMWVRAEHVLAGVAAIALAVTCIRWPYAGLMCYMAMEYLRPSERFPALAPLHIARLVAMFIFIGWLARRRKDGFDSWVRGPEISAVLLFLAVAIASVPGAFVKEAAIERMLDIFRAAIICVLIVNIANTRKRLAGYLIAFLIISAMLSGEQLFNYFTGNPDASSAILRVGSMSGSFLGEDGDFALALCVALPFAWFVAESGARRVWRVFSGLLVVMMIGSIIATGSRGGALGLAATLFMVTLTSKKRAKSIFLVLMAIAVCWTIAPDSYKQRIATIGQSHALDETAQTRFASWRAAKLMFYDHPFLGVGVGNFLHVYVAHYGGIYGRIHTQHNLFYQAASEMGVCGILSFLFILGCLMIRGPNLRRRLIKLGQGDSTVAACAAAILPSTIAFIVGGSLQTPLYYPHMFLLSALSLCCYNITRQGTEAVKE